MKRMHIKSLIAISLVLAACGTAEDMNKRTSSEKSESNTTFLAGNGVPSGPHFQLNMIGVPKNKTATITSGNRIFVPLAGRTQVLLSQGDFAVLDGNGTDGSASFRLPNPDADGDGVTSYSVFVRPVGKPGGRISINTCATDPATGEQICSLETSVSTRTRGRQTFTNVSSELLSISADIDGDGDLDRVPLFDDRLQNFLWSVDNNGLRVLQMRFIEVPSTL